MQDEGASTRVLVLVRRLRRARAGSGLVLDGPTAFAVLEIRLVNIVRKVCTFFLSRGGQLLFGWCLTVGMDGLDGVEFLTFFAFIKGTMCMI
jgi:hypothetical protein